MSKALDLDGVATLIRSGITKVSFLTGAGVSVAAGIPDFRSPGGMYETLKPELLTATEEERDWMRADPTTCVSWRLFRQNSLVYAELRRPFMLRLSDGTWKPTAFHFLPFLFHKHDQLQRIFSQNIDGLDFGVCEEPAYHRKILSVHGALGAPPQCEYCGERPMSRAQWEQALRDNIKDIYGLDAEAPPHSQPIPCSSCSQFGLKPPTVLYGRSLPAQFFQAMKEDLPSTQLLIVSGTSLTVGPANMVPLQVGDQCVRVIANREPVGAGLIDFGDRDLFVRGDSDIFAIALADKLGWLPELYELRDRMADASAEAVSKAYEDSQ